MKKLGLVLAGGGGKGSYQIGVWKYLHECGLDKNIAAFSGTSVGALNAALIMQGDYKVAERIWTEEISDKILGTQTYFCKPYHSWEKGSVENLNKLVRRFLPKGTDFSLIKKTDLYKIQEKLNMIPRKSNNFLSANQIINVALLH